MQNGKRITVIISMIMVVCVALVFTVYKDHTRIDNLEKIINEQERSYIEINDRLKGIKNNLDDVKQIEQERLELNRRLVSEREESISNLLANGFSTHSDLGDNIVLTAADMDKIIDQWAQITNTEFEGRGATFVAAAQQTGLNPIYLLAHAALESGWGNSELATGRHNYYGINAVDSNPNAAYAMGDDIDEGIIAGANWIKQNYYDCGCTTLTSMKDSGYASSDEWESNIATIVNTSIAYLA